MSKKFYSTLAFVGVSFVGTLVLLATAEGIVRIADFTPMEIPGLSGKPPPDGIRIDPIFGPRPRPNWSGRWPQAGFEVATDERGFRVAGDASVRGQGARVAFLGDSCTFGWGVDTNDTFETGIAETARAAGVPVEIINAGYPGDSAAIGPHLLVDRVLPLDPDVVVIGYSGNNAFRFSLVGDVRRFEHAPRQRLLFRSRLLEIAHAWMQRNRSPEPHPRDPKAVLKIPIRERRRVLTSAEFDAALRAMIEMVRSAGSRPVLLIFPRALQVSSRFGGEDPVVAAALVPPPWNLADHMLQYSCLDPQSLDQPYKAVRVAARNWRAFYPTDDAKLQMKLFFSAKAYASNALGLAKKGFTEAVERDPRSPLALYDLGATLIDLGEVEEGMELLARAETASCNVFLQYQVIIRRVASELSVPVIDLILAFQAQPAGPLFSDPAHPSPEAREVIANAAWRVLQRQLSAPKTVPRD